MPDCREDEEYNYEKLNENDKREVDGYDWCAEQVVDNFFANIDVYTADDSYISSILQADLTKFTDVKEYEMGFRKSYNGADGDESEYEHRKIETLADWIRYAILDWIEAGRNELITSMRDNMPDDNNDDEGENTDDDLK